MTNNITIRQLLEVGAHFGHQVRFWNPKMAPYIFGVKSKIHIINLEKTLDLYQQAVNFLSSVAAKKGKILFVGTKQQIRELLRDEAKRCHMPYIDYRWLGGMLTNYKTIRQSLKRLQDLEILRDSATYAHRPKKEALTIMREITKLEKSLGGIRDIGGLPDALFVIDVGHEEIAVSEARKLKIPIVGIVDTNNSPEGIDYVIPGNDDSVRAVKLYLQGVVDAIVTARSTIREAEQVATRVELVKETKKHLPAKKKIFKKKVVSDTEVKEQVKSTPVTAEVKVETNKTTKTKVVRSKRTTGSVAVAKKTTSKKDKGEEKKV